MIIFDLIIRWHKFVVDPNSQISTREGISYFDIPAKLMSTHYNSKTELRDYSVLPIQNLYGEPINKMSIPPLQQPIKDDDYPVYVNKDFIIFII